MKRKKNEILGKLNDDIKNEQNEFKKKNFMCIRRKITSNNNE